MFINPEMFDIRPDTDVTKGFVNLFNTLRDSASARTVTLPCGVYYFSSENAVERKMYITNTIGEDEYKNDEPVNLHKVALCMEDLKGFELDGQGSIFVLDGKMTNIAIRNCENITLKNIEMRTVRPNVHKFTVLSASPFHATFKLDETSDYIEERGKYYWIGTDYKTDFLNHKNTGWWITTAKKENYSHLVRSGYHPFRGCVSLKEIAPRVFKARYVSPIKLSVGQIFNVFSTRRTDVGIFAENTNNLCLDNISQHFNYSLAFVAQNCENISLNKLDFSPDSVSDVEFTSFADFIQICMCRGKVSVTNSRFDSAGDDVLNVHGFHFKIKKLEGNTLTVSFCHPQSYGFDCLREGDDIAFIDSKTLLEKGRAQIFSVERVSPYDFELTLDSFAVSASVGDAIEDLSACPDLDFCKNTLDRIVTRGILVTTRGKVLIEGNKFLNTGMSGILIADDAASWYESGCVRDVTVINNAFLNCDDQAILIAPENKTHAGPVHKNITIENNLFCANNTHAFNIKSTENVTIKNNVYRGKPKDGKWIVTENVTKLTHDAPKGSIE